MKAFPLILNGTPEWDLARNGMITGSNFKTALTVGRDKSWPGETAMKYCLEVASQRMGDEEDEFDTWSMRRGLLLEPEALDEYSLYMMRDIEPASIVFHDTLHVGCTPDGFVRDRDGKGTIECKCRTAAKHASYMLSRKLTDADTYQVQGNLWLTGSDYCDFISYRPLLRNERDRLLVLRVYRDEALISNIALNIAKVHDVVNDIAAKLGAADWKPYHLSLAA